MNCWFLYALDKKCYSFKLMFLNNFISYSNFTAKLILIVFTYYKNCFNILLYFLFFTWYYSDFNFPIKCIPLHLILLLYSHFCLCCLLYVTIFVDVNFLCPVVVCSLLSWLFRCLPSDLHNSFNLVYVSEADLLFSSQRTFS